MAFLSMHEPKANEQWQCLTCGALYAEYVNGCPKCWEVSQELDAIWYNVQIAIVNKRNAKLEADNKALLDALKNIEVLCSQEITARFGGCAHKSEDELGRNSRVYALLVVPRNMARAAISQAERP